MKKVTAKFQCESKTVSGYDVVLIPVTGDSPENKEFFKYTPCGQIQMSVLNPSAGEAFEPGREYLLEFIPVVK
jgi:hypothetical protein